jgi:hypothetical protein
VAGGRASAMPQQLIEFSVSVSERRDHIVAESLRSETRAGAP